MKNLIAKIIIFSLYLSGSLQLAHAEERLRMATTTSTENSGLLAVLHPVFEDKYKVKLDVIAVGSGKAMKLGENGDVDLILVHAPEDEEKFVAAGYGIDRKSVMYNDFVIIGPKTDPALLRSAHTTSEAMQRIALAQAAFISRGDDSGTHKKELALWKAAAIEPAGNWYLSVGQGMGAVLKIADDKQAYSLSDRGTWLAYQDKVDLQIVTQGNAVLFNPYHVIAINPARHPHVKYKQATDYINFITGAEGQKIIENFRINGEALFHPDASGNEDAQSTQTTVK